MLRKFLVPVLLIAQVFVFLLLIAVVMRQPAASASNGEAPAAMPQAQSTFNGLYLWSYSAKFVCGYQQPAQPGANFAGEMTVKPGNYATVINLHNPNYRPVLLGKKFIVELTGSQAFAMEPQATEPRKVVTLTLGADMVTMDDCNNLWQFSFSTPPPAGQMPVFIGDLVILSRTELDVDVVYTANAPGAATATPTGVSIDVERVTGKRIFIPAGILPLP